MNCNHARKLFAAFWDDETTQVEREWLEGHFTSCPACRQNYEQYARTLEALGALPRVEAAPDMVDRVLQRVRRAETVPDRLPVERPNWIPIASGVAAAVLLAVTIASPWLGVSRNSREGDRVASSTAITEPVLVRTPSNAVPSRVDARGGEGALSAADSLFDHSEDVEFILDPVTLHRGRASVTRAAGSSPDEKAVITF